MISDGYTMRYYVDMVGTSAFQSDVVAYPAITLIERGKSGEKVRIAHQPEISAKALSTLCKAMIQKLQRPLHEGNIKIRPVIKSGVTLAIFR